jgi:hypothetical protein
MDVLERAKLRVCESLGIGNRASPLGMARLDDPYHIEEVRLLGAIDGIEENGGYHLTHCDELLAAYDLHRRGLIVETFPGSWTYRRKTGNFRRSPD